MLGDLLNFGGRIVDTIFGRNDAAADRQMQLDAAKKGVQWRVADANAAGVNPLAALGMNPISMSPVSVGTDFGGMGASLGRALDAGSTKSQQADLMTSRLLDAQITGAELDNDIKRAELASMVRRTSLAPGSVALPAAMSQAQFEDRFNPPIDFNTARGADMGGQSMPMGGEVSWDSTPGFPTGEEMQRQYGEPGEWIYSIPKMGLDLGYNLRRWLHYMGLTGPSRYERFRRYSGERR